MPHAYPMMLDVTARLVVVVGGGAVAARKARGVLDAGGRRIRMVAKEFHHEIPGTVERIAAGYEPRHLDGAGLVFAATDSPDVNERVLRDARDRGVLVCRADADEAEPGDFSTPAKFVSGPVVVTVSAAGSPALSAKIRKELAARFDPAWAAMADAMLTLRPLVRDAAGALGADRRAQVFRDLASDEALAALAKGGRDELTAWLRRRYPELDTTTVRPTHG